MTVETAMANLQDLANLSKALNQQSNQVNQILQDLEKKLQGMNLGVEAWAEDDPLEESPYTFIPQDSDREYKYLKSAILGFSRHGGDEFVLTVKICRYQHDGLNAYGQDNWKEIDTETVRPLLQASRELRVKALDKIESLLDVLTREAQSVIAAIEKGRKTVDKL